MLGHAPAAGRPRLDRGDHGHQPPPRDQPTSAWRWRSTPTSPTSSRSRTARSPSAQVDLRRSTTTRSTLSLQRAATSSARSRSPRSQPARSRRRGFVFALELAPRRAVVDHAARSRPHAAQPGAAFARRAPRAGELDAGAARRRRPSSSAGSPRAPVLEADDPALARTYRASLSDLAALRLHPDLDARRDAARGRAAVVHGAVRPRQPDHQLPGAALPARARRDDAARARRPPGDGARRLPRAGARQDPPRAALRRADRARRAAPFAVLRHRRRHAAVPRPARRVPPLDRRRRRSSASSSPTPARRCDWIDDSGDLDGDGYVEYERRNPTTGLVNQCWKDSWDSIQFADGTLARGPIATCEIQGYVYDAQRRARAWPARSGTTTPLAATLEGRAGGAARALPAATSGCPSAAATRSRSTATSARSTA